MLQSQRIQLFLKLLSSSVLLAVFRTWYFASRWDNFLLHFLLACQSCVCWEYFCGYLCYYLAVCGTLIVLSLSSIFSSDCFIFSFGYNVSMNLPSLNSVPFLFLANILLLLLLRTLHQLLRRRPPMALFCRSFMFVWHVLNKKSLSWTMLSLDH